MSRAADGGAGRLQGGAQADGLRVASLGFVRDGKAVLSEVSFAVPRGRLLAVVGASGAGKSTLLSLLAGLEAPSAGTISFDGAAWTARTAPADRGVGMSFDDAALHEHLSVRENIEAASLPRGEPKDRRTARVDSVLQMLGLAPLAARRPATLSAGERRRVAIARAFVRSPDLALLDEPFANLDRANRFTVRQLVRELQRSTKCAAIVVTHDPTDALAIADDLLVLADGTVRAFGPALAIADRPPDLVCAQLVDDLGMHVVETDAAGRAHGCDLREAFSARIAGLVRNAGASGALLGVRPWQIALRAPDEPSMAIQARIGAVEPAGTFTDVVAIRANGRTLRARVARDDAQELPIGETRAFHVPERAVHLFAAPWPGRRLDTPDPKHNPSPA